MAFKNLSCMSEKRINKLDDRCERITLKAWRNKEIENMGGKRKGR